MQVVSEALSAAREIQNEFARARTFLALAPYLNDELKTQLLSATREIQNESERAHALLALAPHLNDELKMQVISEALSTAREIQNEFVRAHAFAALAPHVNEEHRIQLLSAGRDFQNEFSRASLFVALAPHFQEKTKVSLLTEALLGSHFTYEIEAILTEWKSIQYNGLREPAIEFVKRVSINDRAKGLSVLNALMPSLIYFEGESICGEILRAIRDTARWWP